MTISCTKQKRAEAANRFYHSMGNDSLTLRGQPGDLPGGARGAIWRERKLLTPQS